MSDKLLNADARRLIWGNYMAKYGRENVDSISGHPLCSQDPKMYALLQAAIDRGTPLTPDEVCNTIEGVGWNW